ncbi:MAG: histidine kinase dimerization/phosphoacceptor domain -containing protein [Spirochaetia bacterium]
MLNELLSAGSFIVLYTDLVKMREFVTEAVRNIPGIKDCLLCIDGLREDRVYDRCFSCPNFTDGCYNLTSDKCLYEEDDSCYLVPMKTVKKHYGFTVLFLEDKALFKLFESAIHNFANTIAMHIENLDYQTHLEDQVHTRTVELQKANSELRRSRAFFRSVFESTGDSLAVIDKDFNVLKANPSARRLMEVEEIGKNDKCYSLFYGLDKVCSWCPASRVLETGETCNFIIPFPNEENPSRWFNWSASPIYDKKGLVESILESGRDITEIKSLQEDLKKTAEEKELLLREIHHRVKNNLNVVVSLLRIQLGMFEDIKIQDALRDSIERIRSIALVHQYLYQSSSQSSIDFSDFVDEFVADLSRTYEVSGEIRIVSEIEDVSVHIDSAVPVSLIINELVTNAFKYAFPGERKGTITVRVSENPEGAIVLSVRDDGVGLPEDFDINTGDSLGMRLIKGLTQQIEGTLRLSREGGTGFTVTFPKKEKFFS